MSDLVSVLYFDSVTTLRTADLSAQTPSGVNSSLAGKRPKPAPKTMAHAVECNEHPAQVEVFLAKSQLVLNSLTEQLKTKCICYETYKGILSDGVQKKEKWSGGDGRV